MSQRGLSFVVLLVVSTLGSTLGLAAERPSLVVLNLRSEREMEPGLVRLLTEVLLVELKDSGLYGSVQGQKDVEAILDFESQKRLAGCTDDACLLDLAGMFGADLVAYASIDTLGSKYVLIVKLIDGSSREVVQRWMSDVPAHEDVLRDLMRLAAQKLTGRNDPHPAVGHGYGAWPWVVAAAAVIGAGVGAGLGLAAASSASVSPYEPGYDDATGRAQGQALGANLSFGAAGVAAVVSALLFYLDSSSGGAPAAAGEARTETLSLVPTAGGTAAGLLLELRF